MTLRERDIEKFLRNARVKKGRNKGQYLSEGSKAIYDNHLRAYLEWLQDGGYADWYDVRPSDIGEFIKYRKNQGNRGYSITASVNALSRFYEWLSQDYPDEMNPVDRHTAVTSYSGSKTAREEEGYKTGVADEDYRLLLDNVRSRHAERDRLLIRIMGELGLRRSEVIELKLDDVNLETQRVDVPGTKSEPRVIKFWSELKPPIRRWIEGGQRESYQYSFGSEYLLLSERKPKMSTDAVGAQVNKTAKEAGIQEVMYIDANGQKRWKITLHQLRHRFGNKEFRRDRLSLKALSEFMGHSSVEITADRYGQMSDDEVFEMFDGMID
jgi:integrase